MRFDVGCVNDKGEPTTHIVDEYTQEDLNLYVQWALGAAGHQCVYITNLTTGVRTTVRRKADGGLEYRQV